MIKRLSLRMRLTLITIALITVIAVLLALLSAFNVGLIFTDVNKWTVSAVETTLDNESPKTSEPAMPVVSYTSKPSDETPREAHYYIAVGRFNELNWIYTAIVIIAGGITTWFVLGRALTPVKRLSNEIASISENELNVRIRDFQAGDEMNSLADSFNLMLSRLEGAFENQKSFSTAAAHELKTPLATIKARLDVSALNTRPTKGEYTKTLEVVRNQTERMIGIVDDLFLFSTTNGQERNDEVNPEALIRDIVEQLDGLIREKNLTVTVTASDGSHHLMANRSMLERALTNIIENAAKYNRTNGSIDINITEDPAGDQAGFLISVKDTGVGIPKDQTEQIFEPFFRVDKSRSRKTAGAGLGLAIAKKMIEAHGGRIVVKPNEKSGSVFTIQISQQA